MIPIQALMGHISKNIGLFSSLAWLSYAVYRYFKNSFLVRFGNSLMENLMAPFGFPLMGLFGSIFSGKMGGGNAPDVAAQKRRFGVKNGSTMQTARRPLLCKKRTVIFDNAQELRIYKIFYVGTKIKRSIVKPGKRICAPF